MNGELISIEEARELVLAATVPAPDETVGIDEALGRVLGKDLLARGDAPPFACSAMDGYAVEAGEAGRRLSLAGESRAGTPAAQPLAPQTAIRISTGAVVPEGAEAVIRQEDTVLRDGHVETTAAVTAGANIRGPGEDLRAGSLVLAAGTSLRAAELAAAIGAGAGELQVARRPRVSVLCTGDELRAPGEPLRPGQIHNSNGTMLTAMATGCGGAARLHPPLPDDRQASAAGLARALEAAEMTLVAGGVSVGPHDHVKGALQAVGVEERFWRVALQPGKPTWFGVRGQQLVFGLPGNPVSAAVTFALFVRPALDAMLRRRGDTGRLPHEARLTTAVRRSRDRVQALRVRLEWSEGAALVTPNGPQASHIVSSLLGAHALALVPRGEDALPAGSQVRLHPLLD